MAAKIPVKESLFKPFDRLRTNGKQLIPFVVSLSNHERNQPNHTFLKPLATLLLLTLLATGSMWFFATAPTAARADNGCPKAIVDVGQQPAGVRFLDLPVQPGQQYYAFVADGSQPQALSLVPGGYASPLNKGRLFWIAAPSPLALLADYQINLGAKKHDSKGITLDQGLLKVQEPVAEPEPMQPSHLDGVPEEALVCARRFP